MADHHHNDRTVVEDPEHDWCISRCAHGGLHLALERTTVSLSEEEFLALERLIGQAREQLLGIRAHTIVRTSSSRHH